MRLRYANLSGKSSVFEYEIDKYSIAIWFVGEEVPYVYSYDSAGKNEIEQMKVLAPKGIGLNTFIMKYVQYLYVR